MSGFAPLPLTHFRHRLRGEFLTLAHLAKIAGLGRAHVSQVLNGKRSGGRTWGKLREAVEVLAPAALPEFAKLEQWATWNTRPLRSFFVETEVGLMVHRAATAPALASDREIGPEHFAPSEIVFSCRPGVGRTSLSS